MGSFCDWIVEVQNEWFSTSRLEISKLGESKAWSNVNKITISWKIRFLVLAFSKKKIKVLE